MAHKNIHEAFAAAYAHIGGSVTKNAKNPHFRSNYADLGAVMDVVHPALAEAGLYLTGTVEDRDGNPWYVQVIRHSTGGDAICGEVPILETRTGGPQGFIAGLTYARRALTMAQFGIAAEDDDGESAQGRGQHNRHVANAGRRQSAHKTTERPSGAIASPGTKKSLWNALWRLNDGADDQKKATFALLDAQAQERFGVAGAKLTEQQAQEFIRWAEEQV